MVAAEGQLAAGESGRRRTTTGAAQSLATEPETASPSHAATSIDLHGLTTDEAVAALDAFLSDALFGGSAAVRVIHGRSGGRLKAAVHARLRLVAAVRSFGVDPSNPGVTLVTF